MVRFTGLTFLLVKCFSPAFVRSFLHVKVCNNTLTFELTSQQCLVQFEVSWKSSVEPLSFGTKE